MRESSKIKVNNKSKVISIEVDGSPEDPKNFGIKLSDLQHNFPKTYNLSYTENNVLYLLRIEGDVLRLKPNVETYKVEFVKGNGNKNLFLK